MKPVSFEYRPLPPFVDFHASKERNRLIVGGYGSGKSVAGCAEAIALGLEQPGSEILVMRKTVPALRDTTEKTFVDLLPPDFLKQCEVARAGGHLEHITFPTGSIYYFRGCDDWRKHRSMNLAYVLWDEADEFDEEDYDGINTRIRQSRPTALARELGHTRILRRGNILACNPQGHNWIYHLFVGPEKKPHTAYWTSTSLDNPFLPIDYLESLLSMPDKWVRRYVLAGFEDFAGAIYEEWAYETHVVSKPAYDPASYFLMGFDPGTHSGNAALWCYYDQAQHRLVGVAEYNKTGLAASVHAEAWRYIEGRHRMKVRYRIADPQAINVRDRGSNESLHSQYGREGYWFENGPSKVDQRLYALGQLIHVPDGGRPRFVVTDECMKTFEQIKGYRWQDLTPLQKEKGTEAKPLKKDVDLVDAAQYIATKYIAPPKVQPPKSDAEAHTEEIHKAIRAQLARKRFATGTHDIGTVRL